MSGFSNSALVVFILPYIIIIQLELKSAFNIDGKINNVNQCVCFHSFLITNVSMPDLGRILIPDFTAFRNSHCLFSKDIWGTLCLSWTSFKTC